MQVERLSGFDFLRLSAILLVVLSHVLYIGDSALSSVYLSTLGIIGVGTFFFISGYLIYLNNDKFESFSDIKKFYLKRVKRIYPLYVVAITVFFLVSAFYLDQTFDLFSVVIHVLGLQMVFFPKYITYPYIWFIGMIILYYIIYPLIIAGKPKNSFMLLIYSLVPFALCLLLRVKFGVIGGGFFEYYFVFILGIIAAKEQFFTSTLYNRIRMASAPIIGVCLLVIGMTKPVLKDQLGSITASLVLEIGSVMILRMALSIACVIFLYWVYTDFIPENQTVKNVVLAGALASYAVYLFHVTYFIGFDSIVESSLGLTRTQ